MSEEEKTQPAVIGQEDTEQKTAKSGDEEQKPSLFKRILQFIIPWKGDSISVIVKKLVLVVSLCVFVTAGSMLVYDVITMYNDERVSKELSGLYVPSQSEQSTQNGGTQFSPDAAGDKPSRQEVYASFESLLDINPDTVGYIRIDGTVIDYPVVKGEDNDYYLDHDFYGNQSKSGTIMMDYKCSIDPDNGSDNYILYGHHMAVGTFFAQLNEYWRTLYDSNTEPSLSFYKEHPVISFDTLYERSQWKIFAVGLFNAEEQYGEVYPYIDKTDFSSAEEFNDYIIEIMDRSDLFTDVDIQYGDELLTLSTCCWPFGSDMDNVRLVISARKVREGESPEVDVSGAQVNQYVKRWKWVYDNISGGYDWFQSTWDRSKLLSYTEREAAEDGYEFP